MAIIWSPLTGLNDLISFPDVDPNIRSNMQNLLNQIPAYIDAQLALISAASIVAASPPGKLSYFAMDTAPTGWLETKGTLVSRTLYSALFASIGTLYGAGDGTSTFSLPDFRGYFLRDYDDSKGIDTGRVFGSSQADSLLSHNHPTVGGAAGQYWAYGGAQRTEMLSGSGYATDMSSLTTGPGGTTTENRVKNYAVLLCIKY